MLPVTNIIKFAEWGEKKSFNDLMIASGVLNFFLFIFYLIAFDRKHL